MNRLLVVDDALLMRKMISDVAIGEGWEVVGEAKNGLEAVALFERFRPDLVTMDVVMPEMTGLEALRQIRAFDANAKIVMITALDQKQTMFEAIRDGAIDFIVKPFDRDRIKNFLHKMKDRGNASHVDPETDEASVGDI